MKSFEKVVKVILWKQVEKLADNHQFAYTEKRCVDDASICLIDYALKHFDKLNTSNKKHFVKILFVDFSSAFNTIQPHLMMEKLASMNVNSKLILWINEFLTNQFQYVKISDFTSDVIATNSGAPQGCVLSPLLFTLYTSDCSCASNSCQLIKYTDDTALIGRLLMMTMIIEMR